MEAASAPKLGADEDPESRGEGQASTHAALTTNETLTNALLRVATLRLSSFRK
jgi:hypothetical protein